MDWNHVGRAMGVLCSFGALMAVATRWPVQTAFSIVLAMAFMFAWAVTIQ